MTCWIVHPLFWVIALLPFNWIELGRLGGFTISVSYMPALALLSIAAITPTYYLRVVPFLGSYGAWVIAYAVYLPILMISLTGSDAQGMPVRQIFFLMTALACAVSISTGSDLAGLFRYVVAFALILMIEVLAQRVGLSWTDAILRFVTSGDLNFIIYGFFRRVFKALGDPDAAAVAASVKNGLAVAVFTALIVFRAGHRTARRDTTGKIVSILTFGLLVMLNTRSVLLMALVSLPLVWIIALSRRGGITVAGCVGAITATAIGVIGLCVIFTSKNALMSTLMDRFSFDDASTGSRFDQLGWAFGQIEDAIWTGSGYAEIVGYPVHNLFVAAWMHAGLLAFLLVIGFYIGPVVTWARFVSQVMTQPQTWTLNLRPEWIAVLPIVPMFSVWLSGDAGHMNFVEWIGLGIFIGALVTNRLAQPVAARSQKVPLNVKPSRQSRC
jgi:hypothetical protein